MGIMRPARSNLWSAFIWLTALLVLIAGSPLVTCLCPDGRNKLFCLRLYAEAGNSRSVESCCSVAPAKKSCCHRAQREQSDASSSSRPHVNAVSCRSVLTPPSLVAIPDKHKTDCSTAFAIAIAVPSPLEPMVSPAAGEHEAQIYRTVHSPPPTDRIIALCHFVI